MRSSMATVSTLSPDGERASSDGDVTRELVEPHRKYRHPLIDRSEPCPFASLRANICRDGLVMMSRRFSPILAALVPAVSFFVASGCGGGSGGGGCNMPGSTSECSSGELCSNIQGDGNQCRTICTIQTECPADENCEGVANTTLKSCQPVPTPTPASAKQE
jgi:hypothetical protein